MRRNLLEAVERRKGKLLLLLSGGLDSGSLAAACSILKRKVEVATIRYGSYDNPDSLRAEQVTAALLPGCPLRHVDVARDPEAIARDAADLIRLAWSVRKTVVEVCHPLIPALRLAKELGCDGVLNGMAAGCLWGQDRHAQEAYNDGGTTAWNDHRLEEVMWEAVGYPPPAVRVCKFLAEDLGMRWEDPYEDEPVVRWFFDRSYEQLNKPYLKAVMREAFPELKRFPMLEPASLQIRLGVRGFCDIAAKRLRFRSAAGWYADIGRKMGVKMNGGSFGEAVWDARIDQDRERMIREVSDELRSRGGCTLDFAAWDAEDAARSRDA